MSRSFISRSFNIVFREFLRSSAHRSSLSISISKNSPFFADTDNTGSRSDLNLSAFSPPLIHFLQSRPAKIPSGFPVTARAPDSEQWAPKIFFVVLSCLMQINSRGYEEMNIPLREACVNYVPYSAFLLAQHRIPAAALYCRYGWRGTSVFTTPPHHGINARRMWAPWRGAGSKGARCRAPLVGGAGGRRSRLSLCEGHSFSADVNLNK
jgi:hypothetical protein